MFVLVGIALVLYFKSIRVLMSHGGASKKSNVFYAFFSSMMVFLVTVWVATQAIFGEQMWLLNVGFQGGSRYVLQGKHLRLVHRLGDDSYCASTHDGCSHGKTHTITWECMLTGEWLVPDLPLSSHIQ